MGKVASRFAVEFDNLGDTQCTKETRDSDAPRRVDRIDSDTEMGIADSLGVDQRKLQDALDMVVDSIKILDDRAQIIDRSEGQLIAIGNAKHLGALGGIDKLATGVEQFECIPMFGVVRSGDDDAAIGLLVDYRHFGSRGGREARLDDIDAHADEGAYYQMVDHRARDARIATHDEGDRTAVGTTLKKRGKSSRKLYHIDGTEALARDTADGATDARDRFDKTHNISAKKKTKGKENN